MRLPVRHISGHLIWTTNASVWGVWRVDTDNYTHASRATKRERLDALEALFKALRGEVMLLSLCPQVDAASVVKRMTSGVDWDKSPEYIDLSLKVLDQLEELELTGRVDFLAVPLPHRLQADHPGRGVLGPRGSDVRPRAAGAAGERPRGGRAPEAGQPHVRVLALRGQAEAGH